MFDGIPGGSTTVCSIYALTLFSDGDYLQWRTCSAISVFGKPSAMPKNSLIKPQKRRNLDTVQFLFAHGTSVNVPFDGDTPLHMAPRLMAHWIGH